MVREAGAGESPTLTAADTNEEESAVYPMEEYELANCCPFTARKTAV